LKCDGTRAEARFRLAAKRTSPFKSAGASVQSTTGSRGVRISGSNAGYTIFRGSVKGTGYPLHSPVSTSLSLSCVTVCYHISTGIYLLSSSSGQKTKVQDNRQIFTKSPYICSSFRVHDTLYQKVATITNSCVSNVSPGTYSLGRNLEVITDVCVVIL
jgi:hypothetical protein